MPRRKKKQKLDYAAGEVERVAELESYLFGGTTSRISPQSCRAVGSKEEEDEEEELNIPALIQGVGSDLLFLEDRLGTTGAPPVLRAAQWQAQRKQCGARGQDSTEEEEEEEEEEEQNGEEEKGMAGSEQREPEGELGSDCADDQAEMGEQAGEEEIDAAQHKDEEDKDTSTATGAGPCSQQLRRLPEAPVQAGSAVWHDPADAQLNVEVAAQARLRKLRSASGQQRLSGAAYERALRRQHAALHPRTDWAKLVTTNQGAAAADGDVSGGEDDNANGPGDGTSRLLRSAGGLMATRGEQGGALPAGSLDLVRLRDANQHAPSDAVVQSLGWHPNGQLMLTAGFDKKLRLFSVDGLRNTLLQAVHLSDCPIHQASWAAGGGAVVAAGRRPFWYLYDLHAARVERCQGPPAPGAGGKPARSLESFAVCKSEDNPLVAFLADAGHVALISLRSRQPVGWLKMNGTARCAVFDSAGSTLITSGGDGVVYTWDLRMMHRAMHLQLDEGNIGSTSLALSPDARTLASGSSSGVVNVYRRPQGLSLLEKLDTSSWQSTLLSDGAMQGSRRSSTAMPLAPDSTPPARALMNLATAVDTLAFSGDGQLLVMASRLKRDALRVVHVPSLTVYSNWPTSRTPLHYVHSAGFSPRGGFLGIGNAKGHVLLYRITGLPI